jgi:glycosyltransferase involved in cell wall biosynthesis
MMRILQVIATFYPALAFGGPVKVAYKLSEELAKRGHEVEVYTTNAYDQTRDFESKYKTQIMNGFRVTYFKNLIRPGKLFLSPEMIFALRKNVRNFDVVHTHFGRQAYDIAVNHYCRRYGVPYVLHAHGSLPRFMEKQKLKLIYDMFFGDRILRGASKVIALSSAEAVQFRNMGVPDERISVIPNGIDLLECANLPPKDSFKKEFGVKRNQRIVLYLGRIHKTKGIDFLIKAYALLIEDSRFHDVTLVIAGPNDSYVNEARILTNALGVSNRVVFTGFLNEYEKVSAICDSSVVVSPEKFNVFLVVPLEAAALGKPVIVSNTNYISRIVREGKFGFSVDYGNTKELAEKMGKLLGDSNFTIDMSQNGRSFVSKNFNWNTIITNFEKLYKEIIEN